MWFGVGGGGAGLSMHEWCTVMTGGRYKISKVVLSQGGKIISAYALQVSNVEKSCRTIVPP